MTRKNVLLTIAAVAMVFWAGCRSVEKTIDCNADPDEVFGQHYTAADFKIYRVDRESTAEMLIAAADSSEFSGRDAHNFTLVPVLIDDTARVGAAVRAMCAERGGLRALWSCPSEKDSIEVAYLYVVEEPALIDGTAVEKATAGKTKWGGVEVAFVFEQEKHETWHQITADNIGNYLALCLGDRVLSAPMVIGEITQGRCSVAGYFSDEECCALAAVLQRR
jgi:preprotein translocase subunit SecD